MAYFLTIDDGPSVDAISKIDYLNQQHIKSIWFCKGQNLAKNPEAALRLLNTGHILANHSFSHPHFSEISLDEAEKEIAETEKLLDELYRKADLARPAKLFRFPYGDQGQNKDDIQKYLAALNLSGLVVDNYEYREPFINAPNDIDWLWSYDIQEWGIHHEQGLQLTYETVKENLQKYIDNHNKAKDQIILTHDHVGTTQYFEEIVGIFIKAGIEFEDPQILV